MLNIFLYGFSFVMYIDHSAITLLHVKYPDRCARTCAVINVTLSPICSHGNIREGEPKLVLRDISRTNPAFVDDGEEEREFRLTEKVS